jgi:hypothetical protein
MSTGWYIPQGSVVLQGCLFRNRVTSVPEYAERVGISESEALEVLAELVEKDLVWPVDRGYVLKSSWKSFSKKGGDACKKGLSGVS